ncbi:MAG TPA: DUF4157 domain-containing protein [Flavobacteriales bacterium]|nr:DUF4157 domain-containing protein [Flavobacteriales bacterium]
MHKYERKTKQVEAGQTKKIVPGKNGLQLQDNRSRSLLRKKEGVVQKKENNTGLPDNLKSGIENLSGHSMDDVKVHYNSSEPAQLNALAFAQGNQIHIAPGQEKHLPHEAWHVVQQKQGRVRATKQLKSSIAINDDAGLEKEADIMGEKAMQGPLLYRPTSQLKQKGSLTGRIVQRTEGFLTFLKGAAISIVKAPARIVKRTLNVVKHVTWDLGRAIIQKGKNAFQVAPAPHAPLINQLAAADPAFVLANVKNEMIDLRRDSDTLRDLGIALHFMANGVGNIPAMYNNPLAIANVAALPADIAALNGSLLITRGNILLTHPPLIPLIDQARADLNAANAQYLLFAAAVGAATALPGGLPANTGGIRAMVVQMQNHISNVHQLLIHPVPGGLMQEKSPLWNWVFGLVTKSLDVTGLKELIQQLTSLGGAATFSGLRDMNVDEKALAQQIYGSSLNVEDMQLLENSHLPGALVGNGGAFTFANTIHTKTPFSNPANSVADTKQKGVLMHEVLHNAQEQKQGMLSWIELQWGRSEAEEKNPNTWIPQYDYGVIDGNSQMRNFTREQQGAVVQDYSTFMEMHRKAGTVPVGADMIHGDHGSGTFQHYQAVLHGLTQGHWLIPKQNEQWKQTLG